MNLAKALRLILLFTFYANILQSQTDLEKVASPTVSQIGGIYNTPFNLFFLSNDENALIYYTTDGSDPTENSSLFTSLFSVDSSQVIRVRAFKDGFAPSDILTNTYFFNINHTFPIVALSGDPDKFFGEENGLFPNIQLDIEVPINVELYEPNGLQGFNQIVEVELHGSSSLSLDQKSLAIKAKGSLGKSTIDYAIFPDEERTQYRSLILRNSGQDWEYTMFRDAMQSSLTRDLSDLEVEIEKPNLEGQAFRPSIAYINGQYWGIYNLRERLDKRYLRVHYGLKSKEIDFLENLDEAKKGDFVEWNRLDSLLRIKSYSDEAGLNELDALVDLDNYMDYIIFNVFIDNTDWPGNNNRRWRERVPDGKWRWMTKDLDYAFGFLDLDDHSFNTGSFGVNSLDRMLHPDFIYPNPEWATLLFNKLMENEVWKQDFSNRMADQLNVLFSTDRMLQRIDEFQSLYQPEINQHNQKWYNVWTWNQDIEVLRTFAGGRVNAVRNHFAESISEITGSSEVTLTAIPANGGKIKISTITTDQNNLPWKGTYFNEIDIPIQAIPNPGFIFVGWSPNVTGTDASASIKLNSDATISAIFILDDGSEPIDQTIDFPEITDKVVSDGSFSISATASSGLPVSFSIVSGSASISEETVTLDGSVGTVVVRASQAGNEQFNAAPDLNRAFQISENNPPTGNYCASSGAKPWHEYIANISFGSINNSSGKDLYGDFTNQIASLAKGENYPILLTPGFSWFHYEEAFSVWIDWNQDKDFDDFGENVYSGNLPAGVHNATPNPLSSIISVPTNAILGVTRMRVTMQREQPTDPCGTFEIGETEDYSIRITEGTVVTGLEVNCPSSIVVTVLSGESGSTIRWDEPSATTSCPTGINEIIQNSGLANGSYFSIGSAVIVYTITDDCGNIANCTFEVKVLPPDTSIDTYCPSKGSHPWHEYIANVSLNTLDNNSLKEGYGEFFDQSTNLQSGTDYEISLTPSFSYFQYDEFFRVWIDFNGNKSYEEDGELVFEGMYPVQTPNSTPQAVTGIISIPNSIQSISTKMRVSMQRDIPANPCDFFEFGEVEDYTIQLINSENFDSRESDYLNFVEEQVVVFPNPATEILYLQLKEFGGQAGIIQLFDTYGKLQKVLQMDTFSEEPVAISLSEVLNGLYYLRIEIQGGLVINRKVVVSRLY